MDALAGDGRQLLIVGEPVPVARGYVAPMDDRTFDFSAELWLYEGKDAWHFVTLPEELSDEIEERFGSSARGFGSLRVNVAIGATDWSTSIFPSKSAASYVLPVKAAVRQAAGVEIGDRLTLRLTIRD